MKPYLVCCLLSLMMTDVFGLMAIAQEETKTGAANEAEEVKLAREQLQLSREQVALLRLQHAKTGIADPDQQLIDGALFIIAQGTNPQVTLFLEAVKPVDEAKPIWQYGLGRTGMAELVVLYDDKEVFRAPPLNNEIFPSTSSYWRTKAKFGDKGSQP